MVHRWLMLQTKKSRIFKYILCYGSSIRENAVLLFLTNLNTSYVMVHQSPIVTISPKSFYLNTSYVMVHRYAAAATALLPSFKYILCYGSSASKMPITPMRPNLNTSYVMVHRVGVLFLDIVSPI